MTKRDLTGILVRMPPELKSRLADEVAERRSTMNDVAVAILAERFGVPFEPSEFVPGLMHVDLGGYNVKDIEFSAACDVTTDKVDKDLADAIWAHPNDTYRFADVPKTGVKVSRGMTHDGLGKYLSEIVEKAPGDTDDVVGILRETGTDVVVNYLPVGSEEATKWYTEQILNAGCAMVNCMPVFIARERYWQKRFEDAG